MEEAAPKRRKVSHVGAPAIFKLNAAVRLLNEAFGVGASYLVGSSLDKPDWRDVDVRMMLSDEAFARLFPNVQGNGWEQDPRWMIMTVAISDWLRAQTGLPVDFQFQPRTRANELHNGVRHALGLRMYVKNPEDNE